MPYRERRMDTPISRASGGPNSSPCSKGPGVEHLVVDAAQARALVEKMRSQFPSLIDPDVPFWTNISQLAVVKGEYRTSLIVEPADGRMPLTQAGVDLSARIRVRDAQEFDHPEQRPLLERCMQGAAAPPLLGVVSFHQIVQTRDHVVMFTEGTLGVRIIRLGGQRPPDALRRIDGYSTGHWEADILVVQTTHLRADDPAHFGPLWLSRRSRITERFTRVSATELFYQFTVEDGDLYTQPWRGEFSFQPHNGPIYEFACHEGNYSLPNTLRGGQAEAARRAEQKPNPQ
jgi:hypothetical protein